jgi:aspartate aminotransferase
MPSSLSLRVQRIKPSPTLAVSARAASLKAKGLDIISLGAGEPDFDTPHHIKIAAIKAIEQGFTKYTAVEGILSLRIAIVQKFKRDNQLNFDPEQILVSCGGKQSFFNLAQALLNTNDEVIIPAPYWVSYPDIVLLADAKPVIIQTDIAQHFKITPEQLQKVITPRTRLFVMNSPSNPSGMAYTRSELEALAKVLLKHPEILIATDDMYEHILWRQEPFSNLLMVCPELYPRTIILNGVSKTYAMTGWRIGYAAGPKDLIQAMSNVQGQSTSNPCSISQMAALAALTGDQSCVHTMVKAFKERHDFVIQALNQILGVECLPGDGTFYAFVNVQAIIQSAPSTLGIQDDVDFSEYLLQKALVAVVPGTAFGAPGYIRLSFATSLEILKEAMKRLASCIPLIA